MSDRLAGKVCMVTGAGSGIGAAIARRFAAEGGRVVLLDRAIENAKQVAAEIGGTAEARQLDVREAAQVRSMIAAVKDAAGRIDVLVNAAGITLLDDTRIVDIPEETWDSVIAVNLRGPFLMCKYTLPVMIAQHAGVIINMSSQAGFGGGTAYASAKAGLNAITKGIARQHAGDGIRCCTIAPGAVQTPMLEQSKQKLGEGIVAPRPGVVKPVGTPEEVAALAAFLASDEAAYISGTIYAIDGGASQH
ncbi:MAG TPA: SDR family NAD(P)-dependent oxidoreductase [Dehalococcoidia bacterium]|nr:SDR family NAD(P)-dependent oxidoreductase [Dehalococcoidia bacterium]